MNMQKKLKPIVTNNGKYRFNAPQKSEQIILLKALQVTQDPKKLRQLMGVKTVADVYRTLDKMSIRKEYHEALSRAGFDLDKVVKGIADIAEGAEKDDTRLKAYQTILKSIGLDKYDSNDTPSGGTWEEELLKSVEATKDMALPAAIEADYEVAPVEVPDKMKKLREEEDELTKSIYGG